MGFTDGFIDSSAYDPLLMRGLWILSQHVISRHHAHLTLMHMAHPRTLPNWLI